MKFRTINCAPDGGLSVQSWGNLGSTLPIRYWGEVFRQWRGVMDRYWSMADNDFAWLYNERPQVSFLTAAVWQAGWIGLQEFGENKTNLDGETKKGRADAYFRIGRRNAFCEAKFEWRKMGKRSNKSNATVLMKAVEDTQKLQESPRIQKQAHDFCPIVFSVPWIEHDQELTPKKLEEYVDHFRKTPFHFDDEHVQGGYRIDYYPFAKSPKDSRFENAKENLCYPGITMLIGRLRDRL